MFSSESFLEKPIVPMCKEMQDDIKNNGSSYHISRDGCKWYWVKDGSVTPPTPIGPTISLSSPQAGVYEQGVSVGPVTLTATVTPGTNPVTGVDFFRGSTNIQTGLATSKVDNGPFTTDQSRHATATDGSLVGDSNNVDVSFTLPYFWGKQTTVPVPGQALVNSANKVVGDSNGTISINFNSGDYDYIWFAIPNASTSKTRWYVDVINQGAIGGGGDLFGAEQNTNINSPTALRSNQNYKFYISNRQSASNTVMQLMSP